MSDLDALIEILEASVKKHGEKPLTNRWLLNICKLAEKKIEAEEIPLFEWCGPDDIF